LQIDLRRQIAMTLVKRNDIWDELEAFPRSFGIFDDFFKAPAATLRPWSPAVDILETEHELTVRADVPGMKEEDIEVKVENGTLTINGNREFREEEKKKGYHRIERSYGAFTRAFTLPDTVDPDKVTAEYKNGVLDVVFAKREQAKPKSVKVELKK
jgi:HSP20 family protein